MEIFAATAFTQPHMDTSAPEALLRFQTGYSVVEGLYQSSSNKDTLTVLPGFGPLLASPEALGSYGLTAAGARNEFLSPKRLRLRVAALAVVAAGGLGIAATRAAAETPAQVSHNDCGGTTGAVSSTVEPGVCLISPEVVGRVAPTPTAVFKKNSPRPRTPKSPLQSPQAPAIVSGAGGVTAKPSPSPSVVSPEATSTNTVLPRVDIANTTTHEDSSTNNHLKLFLGVGAIVGLLGFWKHRSAR